ncbi:hypothetical protein ACP3S7_02060 [Phytobacter ursingii]
MRLHLIRDTNRTSRSPVSVRATGDYPGCGCALSGLPTALAVAPVSVSATGEDAA